MSTGNVKVVGRFRPPNALELKEGGDIVVEFDEGENTTVKLRGGPTTGPEANGFTFDRVFPMNTRQQDVFEFGIKETVDDVINGYNGTIFAYGQTGSGKTFTMMGADIDNSDLKGIIPRITEQIFDSIMASPPNLEYLVKVSYMEIYMERIRDLLAPQNDNLQIHEEKNKGVYVKGLSDYYVGGQDDVYEIMRQGGNARAVSSTNMNAESSRSHSIFLLTIQQKNTDTGSQKTGNLYLVDLAGSEKVGKTGASGQTLEEAKKINKSLSALGMVINALTDGKSSHIPYRDSKLTRILQESLGGNSRTTLIINASPCAYNVDETISTLRFGVRAKSIKNKARVNAELSPAELKALLKKSQTEAARYQQYIAALEAELKVWRSGGSVPEAERAELGKMGVPDATSLAARSGATRPQTPATPSGIEALKELSSRPDTPTAVSLDQDERDVFLRRENELSDALAKKENECKDLTNENARLRDEFAYTQESEKRTTHDKDAAVAALTELKLKHSALVNENKDYQTSNESLRGELEALTVKLQEAEATANRRAAEDDPEAENRRKEKDARVKAMLESTAGVHATADPAMQLRENLKQLEGPGDHKEKVLDTVEKLHEENLQLQTRLNAFKLEHDNLLIDKDNAEIRLRDLQAAHAKIVARGGQDAGVDVNDLRAGIEAQFQAQQRALEDEVADLKRTMEAKQLEFSHVENERGALRMANDELRRAFASAGGATGASAGTDGANEAASAQLLETAKEMERVRKSMAGQLSDFDQMKKSLMRDLQNRCEKVVELEISLDESKEQYNNVVRSSNTKAQQKKMAFLERNLEQLTSVQKQLVEQNSSLKKEVAIAERKLNARNERIQSLESLLTESQERINQQNAKYEAQMALVRERFESARNLSRSMGAAGQAPGGQGGAAGASAAANPGLAFGRIAKPLRGGGAQAGPQPGPAALHSGAPRHPGVSNVQQQAAQFDSKSPKARSSWFFSSS
ncbi:kinesin-domain-containing protein [Jaminaea rosea]|uniref:Kinesin-domain-containing protein n=1 Tax=Jaminaea rosea TaxID=1569628 RepID=A0A316UYI0_9BASI|nr:kinesin-domain-containing protein [Jaminaea rosea]PWN30366.1 kinesin-domain-containing protein [Jaminaea rosea]